MPKKLGLTTREAEARLRQYGRNELQKKKKRGGHVVRLAVSQFCDVLIVILIAAAGVSLALGDTGEALTIGVILLLNAILGFAQEYNTERALEKLKNLAAPQATVLRDGKERTLPAALLVPGDVVLLHAGDRIPADGMLTVVNALNADESMLTGESMSVTKRKGDMVYAGCTITQGNAVCTVTATGAATEMGRIAGMLSEAKTPQTPLQERLSRLGIIIGAACIVICLIVAVTGVLRGFSPLDMLLTGVSLAVAAVPEGLPAIVTVALALSVGRMVRRRALIRKLYAVETLGCATVICSDKTGTLTENCMRVEEIDTQDKTMLLTIAALCNNATESSGEPTERALLEAAHGIKTKGYSRVDELPFDPDRKRMSVLVRKGDQVRLLTKGAPELLLPLCTAYLSKSGPKPMTDAMRAKFCARNAALAERALRVLGFAYREGEGLREDDLVFCGLVGMMDPPRREVIPAVRMCRASGVRPVMITGDHVLTARAIAEMIDLYREGDMVLDGATLDTLTDAGLAEILPQVSVFARVTPAHKLRIVRAFQAAGHVVAMTGDGVNDAPAVREADIGVAMGKSGTDVTREAAGVVLLDDSFATLIYAVEEGRGIYANIRKFIRYLLACNTGEVCTMFVAMLLGLPVPLIPIQILLVNLVTDGLPAIALGLERTEPDAMQKPPRGRSDSVFSGGLSFLIVSRGLFIGAATLCVFFTLYHAAGLMPARTGTLVTLVFAQLFHVFECKREEAPLWKIPVFDNPALLGAVTLSAVTLLAAIYVPALASLFGLFPLTGEQFFLALGYAAALPLISGILLKVKNQRLQHQKNVVK